MTFRPSTFVASRTHPHVPPPAPAFLRLTQGSVRVAVDGAHQASPSTCFACKRTGGASFLVRAANEGPSGPRVAGAKKAPTPVLPSPCARQSSRPHQRWCLDGHRLRASNEHLLMCAFCEHMAFLTPPTVSFAPLSNREHPWLFAEVRPWAVPGPPPPPTDAVATSPRRTACARSPTSSRSTLLA